LVSRLIRPEQKVGILTARPNLTERHFNGVGWSSKDVPVVVQAMPSDAVFIDGKVDVESDVLEREMLEVASRLHGEHPEVGALVLECTNFVPFSAAMRHATGLPIFDLYTLGVQAYLATVGAEFGKTL
jgi:hypothetical protein